MWWRRAVLPSLPGCHFLSFFDREVVGEAARERIRPVEEAGKMLEWDWGSERLAVAESCLPSRVAEARRLGFGF